MRRCYQCFKEYNTEYENCPHCGHLDGNIPTEPRYLVSGTLLSERYLIGTVVGAGGFGVTYAAWDNVLSQKVAIKEYLPGEFSTRAGGQSQVTVYGGEKTEQFERGKEQFHEESRRLAKFRNMPGIVQIFNSFIENGTVYIVMEFLEGETLDSRLKREGKLPEQDAVNIMLPVLQALEEVHKEGILHRDIAPNNIFLTIDGEVKLLDFGAARSATGSHSKSLTVLYKEGYTPEEQYRSRGDQGPWTDVYACAATLYKMLTGKIPPGALERRRKDTLKEPSKNGAKVSKTVDIAILNALNVDVKYRTQSAGEFLKELMGEGRGKKHFVRTIEKKIGKMPIGIQIGAALLMGAMFAFLVLRMAGVVTISGEKFSRVKLEEGETRVPNLINNSVEDAQKITEEAGLEFLITEKKFSLDIPENRILEQELSAGSVIDEGKQLKVVVSAGLNNMTVKELEESGVEMVEVPDVQYQDIDEILQMLSDAGLNVIVEYEVTGIVEGGKVTKQSVDPGEKLVKGQEIVLTVEDLMIDWEDAEDIESAVRNKIGKENGDIFASELAQIDGELSISAQAEKVDVEVLKYCTQIDKIHFIGDARNLLQNTASLSEIRELTEISFYNISIDKIEWISELQHLNFFYAGHCFLDNLFLEKEVSSLKNVWIFNTKIENVKNCIIFDNAVDVQVDIELFMNMKDVENIRTLRILDFNMEAMDVLKKMPDLKNLSIDFGSEGGSLDFSKFVDLKNITSLTIDGDWNDVYLMNGEMIAKLSDLEAVSIDLDAVQNKDKIYCILENAVQIKELKINSTTFDVSELGLDNLTNLEVLQISCSNLQTIGEWNGVEKIKEISLICAPASFDYMSLAKVIGLETLIINGCEQVDFEALESIENLHTLEIYHCNNLNMGDCALLNKIKKLVVNCQEIDFEKISGSKTIEELEILYADKEDVLLFEDMEQLRELKLYSCGNLELVDLKEFTQLETLYIDGVDRTAALKALQR